VPLLFLLFMENLTMLCPNIKLCQPLFLIVFEIRLKDFLKYKQGKQNLDILMYAFLFAMVESSSNFFLASQ